MKKDNRKALGRGLDSLFFEEVDNNFTKEVPIDEIFAREDQPRKEFNDESIYELSQSLIQYGILQPLIVTRSPRGYTLIAGERRLRAAKLAELDTVPVVIRDVDDREMAEISIIENIQREDLNPLEEAIAYEELMDEYDYTQAELAERVGKSRSYIANTLRLMNLDDKSLDALKSGEISSSQARTLLSVESLDERKKLLAQLMAKEINIREIETYVRREKQRDIYQIDAENRLMEILGTKVRIAPRKKGGKIEIDYYSMDDLNRLLEFMEGM